MLNIGKLRNGGENYYLNSVARGVEDYYLGSGEAPGYWLASGAEDLGLTGIVREQDLRDVLNGRRPGTNGRLAKASKGGRVPGFDLTFRAPKSVALLHALGPKEASNEVVNAHNDAVDAALGYLERHASGARRGKAGKRSIESKGFIGAAFRHRTSRAGDPLLHTHVLVANLIQGADGKWGALDARHLYVQAKTAGYLYQAHLRAELTRRLGVEWTPVRNGTADIEGVPRDAIRAFSTRRAEIEQESERHGDSARAAQVAALATRKAKDYSFSPESLLPEWRARAQALGVDEAHLQSLLERSSYRSPTWSETQELEADLVSLRGLTAQNSTFTRREVLQGICVRLQSGADVADIEKRGEALIASDEVISLGAARADWERTAARRDERFTTAELLATEQALIERATDPGWADAGVAPAAVVERALDRRPSLFDDQKDMVRLLTMSGNGVDLVVGKAGTGKVLIVGRGDAEVQE